MGANNCRESCSVNSWMQANNVAEIEEIIRTQIQIRWSNIPLDGSDLWRWRPLHGMFSPSRNMAFLRRHAQSRKVEKVEKNLPAVQNASYLFYLRKCPEDTRSLSVPTVGPQFLRSKNQQAVEVGMNRVTLLLVELKSRFPIVSRSDFGVKQNERKKERNKGYLYSLNSTLTYREGRRSSKETKIVWTVSVINVRKDCH